MTNGQTMIYKTYTKNRGCSGRVNNSYSTSGTHRISLVTDPLISQEWTGKCLQQMEHIRRHLQHRYSATVNQVIVPTEKRSK